MDPNSLTFQVGLPQLFVNQTLCDVRRSLPPYVCYQHTIYIYSDLVTLYYNFIQYLKRQHHNLQRSVAPLVELSVLLPAFFELGDMVSLGNLSLEGFIFQSLFILLLHRTVSGEKLAHHITMELALGQTSTETLIQAGVVSSWKNNVYLYT